MFKICTTEFVRFYKDLGFSGLRANNHFLNEINLYLKNIVV